jgi:hypothetical protein
VDCIDLVDLAYDRVMWQTFVKTVMNLQAPCNAGYFLTI